VNTLHSPHVSTDAEDALRRELMLRGANETAVSLATRLPTRRQEAWKWSDLRATLTGIQEFASETRAEIPELIWTDIVERNDIIGALACGLAERLSVDPPRSDGWISARDGGVLALNVKADEHVILLETYFVDRHLNTAYTTARIGEGGSLTRIITQSEDIGEAGVFGASVTLGAGARFRQIILAEGAKLARIETHVSVEGEGAEVELNGAYLCGEGRHADLTSVIEHKVGGGTTKQKIHGVALKGGRGVFQGKIVVAPGAQKTDARQHHHGLLLEEGAEIFAKPELMIHADDVQCAHGNAMGGLDESALFYMRARGIPDAEARALLIEAFLADAIPEGLPEAVNEELLSRIRAWLSAAPARAPAVQEGARP
jgi:Fe-S cluster assembly protein SufD